MTVIHGGATVTGKAYGLNPHRNPSMSNPDLMPSALRRFFTPQRGLHLPWLALQPRQATQVQSWADFADTQPGVFRAEPRVEHERSHA